MHTIHVHEDPLFECLGLCGTQQRKQMVHFQRMDSVMALGASHQIAGTTQ
ncbi:MAG: hypothetical protein K9K38_10655 [Rhodoferax sp.]|nr:hypothetical protein [Rhodoferax sp.]MCF8209849.1 hypothetical protein [Rhodoferax sp.]